MSINSEYTLKEAFTCSGVGLHTGVMTTVRVLPANIGEGRYFVRVDLPETPIIPAQLKSVLSTTLSTACGKPCGQNGLTGQKRHPGLLNWSGAVPVLPPKKYLLK